MTVGPWKPIRLETYESRFADIDIRCRVSETLASMLSASFMVVGSAATFLSCSLRSPDGSIQKAIDKIHLESGHAEINWEWSPGIIELWYPTNYGGQPLYSVELALMDQVNSSLVLRTRH